MDKLDDKKVILDELEEEAAAVEAKAADITKEFEDGEDDIVCSADFSAGCTE